MTGQPDTTDPTPTMQTTDNSLSWLLHHLLEQTPGARHALVLSRDGLKLCWSE